MDLRFENQIHGNFTLREDYTLRGNYMLRARQIVHFQNDSFLRFSVNRIYLNGSILFTIAFSLTLHASRVPISSWRVPPLHRVRDCHHVLTLSLLADRHADLRDHPGEDAGDCTSRSASSHRSRHSRRPVVSPACDPPAGDVAQGFA